jgi:hypothetical protein
MVLDIKNKSKRLKILNHRERGFAAQRKAKIYAASLEQKFKMLGCKAFKTL